MFDARAALEGHAAELAAQAKLTKANENWLRAQIKLWGSQIFASNVTKHAEENLRFHDGLMQMAGNATLARLVEQLQIPGYRQIFMPKMGENALVQSSRDHVAIAKAVMSQNSEAARREMEKHVRRTLERALQVFPETMFSSEERMSPVQLMLSRARRQYDTPIE
jgi:DNA-binding GntR family transcriptional regulator